MTQDFLSQEEVDALLKGVDDDDALVENEGSQSNSPRPYDFGQDRAVRGRMPALELINERFARNLRIGLFNYISAACEVSVGPIKVQKYSEFIRTLVVPANINLIQAKPLRGTGLVVFDPNLVFLVIDKLFGGDGRFHARSEGRDFTPTEQRIIAGLLDVVFKEYEKSWKPVYALNFEHIRSEINPQFVNIATPSEMVVTVTLAIELSGNSSEMHVCLPYAMIEPIRDMLSGTMQNEQVASDKRWTNALIRQLQEADLELSVPLGHATVTLGDIVKMKAGDIVPIHLDDQVTASIDGIEVLHCRYGVQNGQYALKVEGFVTANDVATPARSSQ